MNDLSSNRPPKETILLDGCDFEHWLVVLEPPDPSLIRDDIIDSYIKTLAQVLGSEVEARKQIYSVSTRHYFAFGCIVSEELSYKIKELPRVRWVLPDSYLDVKNKSYGGEPFIDGQAVPYDPKYHEEWVRNNARAQVRQQRFDRPRNYDRSRNFERRRENMTNRDMPPSPNPGFQRQSGPNQNMAPVASHEIQNRVPPPSMPNQDFPYREMPRPSPTRDMPPQMQNRDFHNRDMPPPMQNRNFQNSYTLPPMQNRDIQARDMPLPTQNRVFQTRDMPPSMENRDFQSRNMPPPTQNWNFQNRDLPPPTQNREIQSRDIPSPIQNPDFLTRDMPPPMSNRDFQNMDMPSPMQNRNFHNRDMPPPMQN
ncbi:hypothetical protein HHK36_010714 [Tetracentron sinense]|uniref:MORF/ORRM1/DAG-like MORF domain-containing protein n=1 Tax=Tetracentron sinense TaxID=13715 RepID=A0A834ZBI2_TETSI|nr:hypothetical protein HHK36_010714 [Tetracentron sinense]